MSAGYIGATCPHGKGVDDFWLYTEITSNKHFHCACCGRGFWSWQLDDDTRCPDCPASAGSTERKA